MEDTRYQELLADLLRQVKEDGGVLLVGSVSEPQWPQFLSDLVAAGMDTDFVDPVDAGVVCISVKPKGLNSPLPGKHEQE